jgi:hypothetical protein
MFEENEVVAAAARPSSPRPSSPIRTPARREKRER